MSISELHPRASELFGSYVRLVGAEQWHTPTPCTEWDARALVNHLVYEDLWTPPLMAGGTIAEVGDRFEGDTLGGDPVGAYAAAATEAIAAVEAVPLDRTVHLSFGDVPAEEYAWQLFTDHLIHAWDLARAIGADDHLPDDLVAACAGWFAEREAGYRAAGAIGPRPTAPLDEDPQTVLLAAFGRTAASSSSTVSQA